MNHLLIGIFLVIFCSLSVYAIDEDKKHLENVISSMDKTACQLFEENREKVQKYIRDAYEHDDIFRAGSNALGTGFALSAIGLCLDGVNSWRHLTKCLNNDESSTVIWEALAKDRMKSLTGLLFTGAGGLSAGIGALLLVHYGIEKLIEDDLDRELKKEKREREIEKEPKILISCDQ